LVETFAMMLVRNKTETEMLADFRQSLSMDHYRAIVLSRQIVRYEDSGRSSDAQNLQDHLAKRHGWTGKKVYNWVRSGYLADWLWVQLLLMKFQFERTWPSEFLKHWEKNLAFFDEAVWVGHLDLGKDIHVKIDDRLMTRKLGQVRVYGRGDRAVKIVRHLVSWFERAHTNVRLNFREHTLGDNPAIELDIEKGESMKRVEHRHPLKVE
jgi:hypothetical protein